jgi:4-amino-4-deoxy-L-arabinose transferase-like glycosyltransferase
VSAASAHRITSVSPGKKSTAWLSYGIFAVCATLYLIPFMRVLLPWTNEGILVTGAARIVHGQVFARDFFEVTGPGTYYSLAAFFKFLGTSFLAARIYLFLMSLGTGLLVYFLARRLCGAYAVLPCVILAATYYGQQWPGVSYHVDSNFIALLAVACVVKWTDTKRNSLLLASGILAGLTTFFLQQKGILLVGAILAWLLIQRQRKAATVSAFSLVAAGYFALVGVVLAYFWSQGALDSLLDANVLWPFTHYGAVNSVPYAQGILLHYWDHWASIQGALKWPQVVAAILITPFLFVAIVPIVMGLGLLLTAVPGRYYWKAIAPDVVLYWLCGWAIWLSEIHRKDIYHLVFGAPLLIILCIHLLTASHKKSARYALQILAVSSAWLAAFNLIGVLTAHNVATRAGSVAMFHNSPTLAFIDAHVAPGEEMFAYPNCPIYYFLSSTENPTRYSNLVYNMNTTAQFQEVIGDLDRSKVKYVVWDTNFEAKTVPVMIPEAARTPPDGFIMETYLQSHYKVVEDDDGIRIMERREDSEPK